MDWRVLGFMTPVRLERMHQNELANDKSNFDWHLKNKKPVVAWDEDKTKFAPMLVIDGNTYKPERLFDVPPFVPKGRSVPEGHSIQCPDKRFIYCHQILQRRTKLLLFQNKRRGRVFFTTDVVIPVLAEKSSSGAFDPWMSVTPMEVLTMRRGIQLAKDTVVIGGLGLGYLLRKVCEKKSVKRVIVVESAQWILDWIGPRLRELHPQIAEKTTDWICGDVYDYVGKFGTEARHLLDIWQKYGGCDGKFSQLKRSKTVKHLWGWGDVEF